MMDGEFKDQVIPDWWALKVKENKAPKEGNAHRERKACKERKRVDDPADVKRYIVVGS